MGFNLKNFFSNGNTNKIVSVEEDNEVDYLDKISSSLDNPIKEKENKPKEEMVMKKTEVTAEPKEIKEEKVEEENIKIKSNPKDDIKKLISASGLDEKTVNNLRDKMKETPGSAQRMIKSVLEMMAEEEKENQDVIGLVKALGKKLSQESLVKIVAAFIILIEEENLEKVLADGGVKKSSQSLEDELKSIGAK